MRYIARTNQVRTAVLARPDLCDEMRRAFEAHYEHNGRANRFRSGNSRVTYTIGTCTLPEGELSLLLKLHKTDAYGYEYEDVKPGGRDHPVREELGVFEVWYEYVAGMLTSLPFVSDEVYAEYVAKCKKFDMLSWRIAPREIDLTQYDEFSVDRGDLGAVPYFQMAARYKKYFGVLTEGLPPLIQPKGSAKEDRHSHFIEHDRIIDLSSSHNNLAITNSFRTGCWGTNACDDLGLAARGVKYFGRHNLLNL